MKKLFLLLLVFCSFITVKAYENDYFKIDIPDGYTISKEGPNAYKWDKGNGYIAVSLADNSKSKYNIKYFSEEDINKQKYYIEDNINEKIKEYNVKASVTSIEKKNDDDLYYLEYVLYLPSKKAIGYDIYQKGRIYTLNNYLITVIYNTDKEIKDEDYKPLVNSFKINDTPIDTRIKNIIIIIVVTGVVLGIIGYFVDLKKKKH